MNTTNKISAFYEDVKKLGLRFPVAEISRRTGYRDSTVSQYLKRKIEPSAKFIDKFYEVFELKEKIPTGGQDLGELVKQHAAILSVLIAEVASLRSSVSGEHSEVIARRLQKAAEDVLKLSS